MVMEMVKIYRALVAWFKQSQNAHVYVHNYGNYYIGKVEVISSFTSERSRPNYDSNPNLI